jgi:hypothetical protein
VIGLKANDATAECTRVTDLAVENIPTASSAEVPPRRILDQLLGGVSLGGSLRTCGLFLILGMASDWLAELHTVFPGINVAASVIGLAAYVLCFAFAYVSVRVWQIRHTRSS